MNFSKKGNLGAKGDSQRVEKGQISCAINNVEIDIDIKRYDDPEVLARRVLLTKGLGLKHLEKLAENIREF